MTGKPLAGLKVLELARILAGPWAGQVLADLGAEVIKVESPEGDDTRRWGPPFVERDGDRTAAYFYGCNRGKQSVQADFRKPDDLAHVQRLAQDADVVIENFKLGGLTRFGLDYAGVAETNPGVVYCSITGFGQTGPRAPQPGYDLLIQAMSGVMDITGAPDGAPTKMGVAFADIFSGLYATIAIQAALAERTRSGRGQHIDVSLFDCMTGVLANQAMNAFVTGNAPSRNGNRHPNLTPYEAHGCADGHLVIAVGNDRQFGALCRALGQADMAQDARFATNADRLQNRPALEDALTPLIRAWTRDALIATLTDAGVPAGPINTVGEAFGDPQALARGLRIDPEGVPGVRMPVRFSRSETGSETTAPQPGSTELAKAGWAT